MEYKQIQELIKTINKSNISELHIEEGDFKITIKQELAAPAQYVSMSTMPMQMPQQAPQQAQIAAPQASSAPATSAVSAASTASSTTAAPC